MWNQEASRKHKVRIMHSHFYPSSVQHCCSSAQAWVFSQLLPPCRWEQQHFLFFPLADIWLSASVTWAKADGCFRYMWTSSFPSGRGLFWHQAQTVCRCFLQSQTCRHGRFRGRHIFRGFGFVAGIQLLINLFQNKEYPLMTGLITWSVLMCSCGPKKLRQQCDQDN